MGNRDGVGEGGGEGGSSLGCNHMYLIYTTSEKAFGGMALEMGLCSWYSMCLSSSESAVRDRYPFPGIK